MFAPWRSQSSLRLLANHSLELSHRKNRRESQPFPWVCHALKVLRFKSSYFVFDPGHLENSWSVRDPHKQRHFRDIKGAQRRTTGSAFKASMYVNWNSSNLLNSLNWQMCIIACLIIMLRKVITGEAISARVLIMDAFVFCHIRTYIRFARGYNYSSSEHCKHYSDRLAFER